MNYLFQDGGKPKAKKSKTKSKTATKTTKTTKSKSSSKTGTKTTKSKTKTPKKGGNFLGAVGELVAPTGWGPFATAAGLLALDRADAALRRGKSTKSEKSNAKKGGMRGGTEYDDEAKRIIDNDNELHKMFKTVYIYAYSPKMSAAHYTGPMISDLSGYIEQEIKNRHNLIKGMTESKLIENIQQSIIQLKSLQEIGSTNHKNFKKNKSLPTNQSIIDEYESILKEFYRKPKYNN